MGRFYTQKQFSEREAYEQKYKVSRMNLLFVVICTAVNLLLLVANADSYFLFSAFVPYYIAGMGMLLCGRFPAEYYIEELEGMTFLDDSVFVVLLVLAIALTLLYLLAWFMSSKNRVGWLIFALVFFGLDTLGLLLINGIALQSLIDILFHAWVIYYLILGINAHAKLQKLPAEAEIPYGENPEGGEWNPEDPDSIFSGAVDSPILRVADKDVKHKVLLEARVLDYHICYRRVKHTNELVINGNVYDELEGVMEYPHILEARIDGHHIAVGLANMRSFIEVDGETIAKKWRLV